MVQCSGCSAAVCAIQGDEYHPQALVSYCGSANVIDVWKGVCKPQADVHFDGRHNHIPHAAWLRTLKAATGHRSSTHKLSRRMDQPLFAKRLRAHRPRITNGGKYGRSVLLVHNKAPVAPIGNDGTSCLSWCGSNRL